MQNTLEQKNNFVIALREHLQSKYQTKHHYTYGEGEFEGQKIGDTYCLVRRNPNKPKDISGFCFRKDLCFWGPQSEADILKEVHEFASRHKNLRSIIDGNKNSLEIRFSDKRYLAAAHIEGGYAGEISLYFMELPSFEIAA